VDAATRSAWARLLTRPAVLGIDCVQPALSQNVAWLPRRLATSGNKACDAHCTGNVLTREVLIPLAQHMLSVARPVPGVARDCLLETDPAHCRRLAARTRLLVIGAWLDTWDEKYAWSCDEPLTTHQGDTHTGTVYPANHQQRAKCAHFVWVDMAARYLAVAACETAVGVAWDFDATWRPGVGLARRLVREAATPVAQPRLGSRLRSVLLRRGKPAKPARLADESDDDSASESYSAQDPSLSVSAVSTASTVPMAPTNLDDAWLQLPTWLKDSHGWWRLQEGFTNTDTGVASDLLHLRLLPRAVTAVGITTLGTPVGVPVGKPGINGSANTTPLSWLLAASQLVVAATAYGPFRRGRLPHLGPAALGVDVVTGGTLSTPRADDLNKVAMTASHVLSTCRTRHQRASSAALVRVWRWRTGLLYQRLGVCHLTSRNYRAACLCFERTLQTVLPLLVESMVAVHTAEAGTAHTTHAGGRAELLRIAAVAWRHWTWLVCHQASGLVPPLPTTTPLRALVGTLSASLLPVEVAAARTWTLPVVAGNDLCAAIPATPCEQVPVKSASVAVPGPPATLAPLLAVEAWRWSTILARAEHARGARARVVLEVEGVEARRTGKLAARFDDSGTQMVPEDRETFRRDPMQCRRDPMQGYRPHSSRGSAHVWPRGQRTDHPVRPPSDVGRWLYRPNREAVPCHGVPAHPPWARARTTNNQPGETAVWSAGSDRTRRFNPTATLQNGSPHYNHQSRTPARTPVSENHRIRGHARAHRPGGFPHA
jgi:hypothetical protein